MNADPWIEAELQDLRRQGLERRLEPRPSSGGKWGEGADAVFNLSSNDYLNLSRHPEVTAEAVRAIQQWGNGSTASRLVSGTLKLHEALERELACFKGYPSALVFGSGYLANVGAVSALVGKEDRIFADRLIHASLIDGSRLSGAHLLRFQHNDMDHLADLLRKNTDGGRTLIISESVFSMDGDLAPIRDIATLARVKQALVLIDEAHSTGVYGPHGEGLISDLKLQNDIPIAMGTLSKAMGGYGGFIATSEALRAYCINRARSFIFSTALPPPSVGAALGTLKVLRDHPELGSCLLYRAKGFRNRLQQAGLDTGQSSSQIIPIIIGDNQKALSLSARLRERNVLAMAIRPPTVPVGTARLRLSVTLAFSQDDLDLIADRIIEAARLEGLI